MAVQTHSWNINLDGNYYKVNLEKNKLSINDGEAIKLSKLPKKSVFPHMKYFLKLGNREAVLNVQQGGAAVITIDGIDYLTGKPYSLTPMPGWAWIFIVLHILNFILVIGGAIGGACLGGMSIITMSIAAGNEESTGKKVMWCTIIWLVSTVIEFILAMLFAFMFSSI